MTTFGQNVKYLRERAGLTKKDLSKLALVSAEFISDIENKPLKRECFAHRMLSFYLGYGFPYLRDNSIIPIGPKPHKTNLKADEIESLLCRHGHCTRTANFFIDPF